MTKINYNNYPNVSEDLKQKLKEVSDDSQFTILKNEGIIRREFILNKIEYLNYKNSENDKNDKKLPDFAREKSIGQRFGSASGSKYKPANPRKTRVFK